MRSIAASSRAVRDRARESRCADALRALEQCDDYLARPFVYEELVARIRALLRRRPVRAETIDLGELVVDRPARRVIAGGVDIVLSAKEYALLVQLASDPTRVFTREQLLRDVWGYRSYCPDEDARVTRVARALQARRRGLPGWVVNVWGVGYKLRPTSV
jgi:Response regulators consisting of a CheY-like receiver domain and a winged-helix DNA-binding domain